MLHTKNIPHKKKKKAMLINLSSISGAPTLHWFDPHEGSQSPRMVHCKAMQWIPPSSPSKGPTDTCMPINPNQLSWSRLKCLYRNILLSYIACLHTELFLVYHCIVTDIPSVNLSHHSFTLAENLNALYTTSFYDRSQWTLRVIPVNPAPWTYHETLHTVHRCTLS